MKRLFPGTWLVCLLVIGGAQGCKFTGSSLTAGVPANSGAVTDLPSDPTEVNETVCVGVSPESSAWMAEPYPIRFPVVDPDAQQGQGARTDVIGDATPEADSSAARPEGQGAGQPEAPDPDAEPCIAEPGTCLGAPPPEWALLDFQPQSCGSGATYGLKAFHGHVTVMALFASW